MGYNEMDKVWDNSQAGKTDKLVLLAIARRYKPGVGSWPSQEHLAKTCGVNVRSIRACLTRLEKLGELTWIRGSNLSKKANLYYLTAVEGAKTPADLLTKTSAVLEKTPAEIDKNTRLLNKELNNLLNSDFESFWSVYPRKDARKRAEQAFDMLTPNLSIDALLSATRTYRDKVADTELKFVMLACNWLEQECWLDQVDVDDDWIARARKKHDEL
jgi:DNA-binding transcriptional regulator YhcF (GntR family)